MMNKSPGIPEQTELDDAQQISAGSAGLREPQPARCGESIAFAILFLAIALPSCWGVSPIAMATRCCWRFASGC